VAEPGFQIVDFRLQTWKAQNNPRVSISRIYNLKFAI